MNLTFSILFNLVTELNNTIKKYPVINSFCVLTFFYTGSPSCGLSSLTNAEREKVAMNTSIFCKKQVYILKSRMSK